MTEPPYAQVKTNPRFELGWNRLQTGIQIFVGIVVAAGLLGLFGTGPLSGAQATTKTGAFAVRYERILRRTAQTDMTIGFAEHTGPQLEVDLPASFVREMDIVSTSPRSTTMRATGTGVAYVFDVSRTDHGDVTLSMKPKSFGLFTSRFDVGGTAIAVRQLVWP